MFLGIKLKITSISIIKKQQQIVLLLSFFCLSFVS